MCSVSLGSPRLYKGEKATQGVTVFIVSYISYYYKAILGSTPIPNASHSLSS